jgi:hypothetical protein
MFGTVGPMDEFVSALSAVSDGLLASDGAAKADSAWLAYVREQERIVEAASVAPCVTRLVTSELHPPRDGTPVGPFSNRIVPPLGRFLPHLGEHESAVRRLVLDAVAYGYFAMIDAEATAVVAAGPLTPVAACRTAEQVWPYWVTSMSTGRLLAEATSNAYINSVESVCGEELYRGLLKLGLVGRRRRKIPYMGHFYGQAGMLLRFVQTDNFVPGPESELRATANRWAFEALPTE